MGMLQQEFQNKDVSRSRRSKERHEFWVLGFGYENPVSLVKTNAGGYIKYI